MESSLDRGFRSRHRVKPGEMPRSAYIAAKVEPELARGDPAPRAGELAHGQFRAAPGNPRPRDRRGRRRQLGLTSTGTTTSFTSRALDDGGDVISTKTAAGERRVPLMFPRQRSELVKLKMRTGRDGD